MAQILSLIFKDDDGKKTYQNTAQCDPPNSQGLFLNVNQLKALLELQAQKNKSGGCCRMAFDEATSKTNNQTSRNFLD